MIHFTEMLYIFMAWSALAVLVYVRVRMPARGTAVLQVLRYYYYYCVHCLTPWSPARGPGHAACLPCVRVWCATTYEEDGVAPLREGVMQCSAGQLAAGTGGSCQQLVLLCCMSKSPSWAQNVDTLLHGAADGRPPPLSPLPPPCNLPCGLRPAQLLTLLVPVFARLGPLLVRPPRP